MQETDRKDSALIRLKQLKKKINQPEGEGLARSKKANFDNIPVNMEALKTQTWNMKVWNDFMIQVNHLKLEEEPL